MASSSLQFRRSQTNGNTAIPPRLLSMGRRPSRPVSNATSIDSMSDAEEQQPSRRKSAQHGGGWQSRKQSQVMRHAEQDDVSDAESFDSLSSRAKFMSDLLSDSDSAFSEGRNSMTSISSYGPDTPKTPAPEYMNDGYIEIYDEKTPRERAVSMEVTGSMQMQMKEMTTQGPRGPHLFRSFSTSHASKISTNHISLPTLSIPSTPIVDGRSPSTRSPSVRTPSLRSPSVRSPSVRSPSVRSPSVRSPSLRSPTVHSPSLRSPSTRHSHRFSYASSADEGEEIMIMRPQSECFFDTDAVRGWATFQVCRWMAALFDQEMVDAFAQNDITGAILIDLKWEDLKELGIHSFGKRTELWTEINHLRAASLPTPDRAEFVQSSARLCRSGSVNSTRTVSTPRLAQTPRMRSNSSVSVGSQMMTADEFESMILPDLPVMPQSARSARFPSMSRQSHPQSGLQQQMASPMMEQLPAVTMKCPSEPDIVSEADEEGSDDGPRQRTRPQVRKKSKRMQVRMPQRTLAVDSIIIQSDDEAPGGYVAKIEAMTSFENSRPIGRSRSKRESLAPSDSVSLRAARKYRKKSDEPKAHNCKKGDRCRKHGKQAQLTAKTKTTTLRRRIRSEVVSDAGTILIATTPSIAAFDNEPLPMLESIASGSPRPQSYSPSIIASSDALGQFNRSDIRLKESVLREVSRLDPLDNVRKFLTHQHLQHMEERRTSPPPVPNKSQDDMNRAQRSTPSPPPVAREMSIPPHSAGYPSYAAQSRLAAIPAASHQSVPMAAAAAAQLPRSQTTPPVRSQTPSCGLRIQGMEQVVPPYASSISSVSARGPMMRTTTPFSEADVPCPTGTPVNFRDQSQSVPPDAHYRRFPTPTLESLTAPIIPAGPRSAPLRPTHLNIVDENAEWEAVDEEPKMAPSPSMRTHSGWMKKRRTNWFRHEWPDHHFVLRGTRLGYARDVGVSEEGAIDMDQYQVACSNSGSTKLSAAFKAGRIFGKKKEDGTPGSYFFQLVPANDASKGGKKSLGKVHCFAVGSREERIDWMRELMLAKAIKQKGQGFEVEVNGERV